VGSTGARFLGIALVLTMLGESAPVRADYVRFLMEYRRKADRRVLLLRQIPDHSHGFDQYFLEEQAVPGNTRVSQQELAGRDRSLLVAAGQYELYRSRVDTALQHELERFQESGYLPLCRPVAAPVESATEVRLAFGSVELLLKVEGGKYSEVLLALGGQEYRLMRFPALGAGITAGHRGFREVVLLDQGRMLGVVVRAQLAPAPANEAEDSAYFFPLKRASARLGFPLPLEAKCTGDNPAGEKREE